MLKAILTLIGGIVIGLAVAHFVFGPIDWSGVREETGDVVSDAATVAAVRSALALQKDFALFGDVAVSAADGVVTLSGTVDTEEQRELAVLISRGVHGVTEVVDELEVTPAGRGVPAPERSR
jgi:hyperosmotically inducible protein